MPIPFIHLRVHTEYSLIDGLVRIEDLIDATVTAKMPAIAITDQNNLFATVKFYKAAVAAGLKPIIGVDVSIANPQDEKLPFRLTLLAQNEQGYKNMMSIVSRAYIEGQENGTPLLKKAWLFGVTYGIIALSGGREGDVGHALLAGNLEMAKQLLQEWLMLFPDRFYLDLQRTGRMNEEDYIHAAITLAQTCDVPVVATNDVRFLTKEDFEAHEARVCIHNSDRLDNPRRPRLYSDQQYLRSADEMCRLFQDIPEALANTVAIAKRCNMTLRLDQVLLPHFPVPAEMTIEAYLEQHAKTGLTQRLQILLDTQVPDYSERLQAYQDRLQAELNVINSMGFAGYFLIVSDFIQWAKDQGIPVGPGRGSGAGSLVAYALKITDLDPLQYDLLFERFLNPERVSMPDFDIDFCINGRDRVIDYVTQRYGRESVSQIITFGTMAAKAVVRDVGRVLGHPYGFVDKIAKLIPFELGMTLEKALEQEAELRQRYEQEDDVRTLIDLAMKLEGIARNAGKHAGGVVIAPSLLTDYVPLYCEAGSTSRVTQFDKDDLEKIGLVKFDFLGLRNLTIIDWAVRMINAKRECLGEPPIDISLLPMNDQATFTLLKACITTAVFQLESRGMKDLIKRLQPDCFEEVIALVALFRPGPLQSGMVDDFIDRKHGRTVKYSHPALEPILRPTYGIILYQEQVMQIAQELAGYTLGSADLLRRAMGKKKPEEMAKQRAIFTEGANVRGISKEVATSIFDLMEKFAGYGFNKSHSAAYALIAYQTAWLKAHYPAEFMAAVLSSDMDHTDKIVTLIEECRQMNLQIIPPDIQRSHYKFYVAETGAIVYGLGAIKGVGEAAVEAIIEARKKQNAFQNLFDLCRCIDLRKVNRRVLEALICAGALDCFGIERAMLMASLGRALQFAEQQVTATALGQHDLFGSFTINADVAQEMEYVKVSSWDQKKILAGEKETLGFYLSGHPLDRYSHELENWRVVRMVDLKPTKSQTIWVAGLVVALRTMNTKRGDRMAFITLDDRSGRIELAVFPEVYETHKQILAKDQLLMVEGEVSVDDFTGGYRLSSRCIYTLVAAREHFARRLLLHVAAEQLQSFFFERLSNILSPFCGGVCPIVIQYQREDAMAELVLGAEWKVRLEDDLLDTLRELLGVNGVVIQ